MAENTAHQLAIIGESSYGVTPTNPTMQILRNTGCSIKPARASVDNPEVRADRQHAGLRLGSVSVGGSIDGILSFLTYSMLMEGALTEQFLIDTPSAGTNQLKNGVLRQSFMVERHFTDLAAADKPFHRYHGCEVAGMTFKAGPDANVDISAEIIAQSFTTDTAQLTGATYTPQTADKPMTLLGGNVSVGGASSGVTTSIDIAIKNAMSANPVATSNFGLRPSIGPIDVTGTISVYFLNSSNLDALMNETTTSLETTFTDGTNAYRIVFPLVQFTDAGVTTSGSGTMVESIPFRALPDPVTGATIIIEEI